MKSQIYLLYSAVFITIIGFGMVFPLLPVYAQSLGATPTQIGLLAASFSITEFIVAPIAGRISDRFGRKPVLLTALIGTCAAFVLFGLAPSLSWLFLARALHGVFSGATFPIVAAYIGDATTKKDRVIYMSRLTAVYSLGFIIGPASAGLLSAQNIHLPFYVAAVIALLNAVFILALLPESLSQKTEKLVLREGFINISALIKSLRGEFGVLFFLLFAWAFAIANFQVAFPLFTEEKFHFTATTIGYMFTYTGIISTFNQLVLLPRIIKSVGEYKTIAFGIIEMTIGQFLIPFSPTIGFLLLFTAFSSLGGSLFRPAINAVISKHTHEGQGSTMGLAYSFESLGRIVGPLVAGVFIAYLGLTSQFVLTSLILIAGFFLKVRFIRNQA